MFQTMTQLTGHDLFLNRELGVLAFNERVMAMAKDTRLPLLERLKYLCIAASNLDEFFEVRVAGLMEQARQNPDFRDRDGLTAPEVLGQVSQLAHALVQDQYALFNTALVPALEKEGIFFHTVDTWTPEVAQWAQQYFEQEVIPVLTPIGLDPAHPFPVVLNKSLNFAVELSGEDAFGRDSSMAVVQAPRILPRLIRMPADITPYPNGFIMLTSIMQGCVPALFPGMEVKGIYQFRVTRNSDLYVDEEEITNLRVALQGELSQRHFGHSVRLEIADKMPEHVKTRLQSEFDLTEREIYRVNGPVNLVRLMQVADWVDRPDLKFKSFSAGLPSDLAIEPDIFKAIAGRDILLHHPYQSFTPVVEFLKRAAHDPDVVAIKQTIYRTGNDSELMDALMVAAKNGKEVTVVLELMARFDEEANIRWASRLEQVGAHVVYGVVGHKTHAKMLLVVRRERTAQGRTSLKRYVHLGTGNYHPRTARLYTDFGLFTVQEEICNDVHEIFQQLTGLGKLRKTTHLWQSPFTMQKNVLCAIRQEIAQVKAGRKGFVMARMNALLEPSVISELYAASRAGVKVDLIVRGVCALRPGVKGLSENIRVRSVVGRFLEHSRIYYFYNDGQEDVYLSSADWMDRNLFRRVEIAFPVLDKKLKKRVVDEGLKALLADHDLAWIMDSQGGYSRRRTSASGKANCHTLLLTRLAQGYSETLFSDSPPS
jgi:polyphosphate kinase